MQTALQRRRMLVDMGLAEPIPSLAVQRTWCWIDDRVPPAGEADGEFNSHATWVNKASSWIGWTGAKCYDARDRRCRNGADMQRAHEEGAFPVRWYLPERFAQPVVLPPRVVLIRSVVAVAGEKGISLADMRATKGLGSIGRKEVERCLADRAQLVGEAYVMSADGVEETRFEADCQRRASYVRKGF